MFFALFIFLSPCLCVCLCFSRSLSVRLSVSVVVSQGVCTEAGMYALRERRVHVTQEDFEMAVAKVINHRIRRRNCELLV